MRAILSTLVAGGLVAAGAAGRWWGVGMFEPYAIRLVVVGLVLLGYRILKTTYYRSGMPWPASYGEPEPLRLRWLDYLKAFICWADAFKRTYAVAPGLYYTGSSYDRDAPLLVTANYLLTVLLAVRRVREFNARLLVVDTDGINVWCSAGKGKFSRDTILDQLERYDRSLLSGEDRPTLILPKVSFSGVDLASLRGSGIRPVIGPVYAKDLPQYLSDPPLNDCSEDRVVFGLQSRLFTWLPGLLQTLGYSFTLILLLWIAHLLWGSSIPAVGILLLTVLLATAYPILFPWLPGTRFAVKGLWLGAGVSVGIAALTVAGLLPAARVVTALLFAMGSAVFFSLAYTGNSAVSNYSRIRRETAHFLPLYVLLYIASLVSFIITEVAA